MFYQSSPCFTNPVQSMFYHMPFHVCYLFTFVDCFEILTCHVFLHGVCNVSFIRRYIFQVIKRKKKSSSASVLNSYNFTILTIRETFLFHTEIYTFRIFIRSLICYFYFSSCLRCEGQCVVFFPRGAREHTVVMVNDPFLDLPFFW